MDGIKICLLGLLGAILSLLFRQWKSDYQPMVRIAVEIVFAMLLIRIAQPLITELQSFTKEAGLGETAEILFRAVGIAVLCKICGNFCKECGENGIAEGIDWAGKIGITALSFPLMKQLFDLAKEMLSLGS